MSSLSEDDSVESREYDWSLMKICNFTMFPIFMSGALLLYKDSIAELARSRAAHSARWNLDGQYAAFKMSHYKTEAAADARHVKDKLVEKLGVPVFLDSDDLQDLRNLCHQVSMSDVLVLFQTRGLLTRPWCLVEIYTALTEGVPIVAVCVAGAFPYNFADAQYFLDNLETELELRNPGASNVVQQAGVNVPAMAKLLRENLPNIISKRWEPGASEAVLGAQLEDIVTAMENSRMSLGESHSKGSSVSDGLGDQLL